MKALARSIGALVILLILLLPAMGSSLGATQAGADPCPRSAAITPGPGAGAFYTTVSPFEHFDSQRTQVFPYACSVSELGTDVQARSSSVNFSTPYVPFTRDRGELFVYGYGLDAATQGGFVSKVDTETLNELWRTQILATAILHQWSYPGVGLSHGNGFLYATYANIIVKLDPITGETLIRRELPQDPTGTGATYNGMIVMPDGRIVAKGMERGPCPPLPEGEPTVDDPDDLTIITQVTPPEPSTGRITYGQTDGNDYVYVAGDSSVFRYIYDDGQLTLDEAWGPVTYRTGAQTPDTAPGVLGDYIVVQSNFLPTVEPLTVTAIDARDANHHFTITPFPDTTDSWNVSKPVLDADNNIIITNDDLGGKMAGVRLDPVSGLSIIWSRGLVSQDFSALVGDPTHRNVVITNYDASTGDRAVWLDEATGETLAQSDILSSNPAPGNIVMPGFDGKFYYIAADGTLTQLSLHRAGSTPTIPATGASDNSLITLVLTLALGLLLVGAGMFLRRRGTQ